MGRICDFLNQSKSQILPEQSIEAKKEDITAGLGQCIAEMVAAQVYNARENHNLAIYGTVTTGSIWRFLQLQQQQVFIDKPEYYLHQIGKILGILHSMTR